MSDIRTLPEIKAALARCDAATPGPWEADQGYHGQVRITVPSPQGGRLIIADVYRKTGREGNWDFIARARTDLPAALRTAEAALELVARFKADIEFAGGGPVYHSDQEYRCAAALVEGTDAE